MKLIQFDIFSSKFTEKIKFKLPLSHLDANNNIGVYFECI